ncbi:hypothetical protein [Clostridium sp. VAP52]|uniref:hypothetical protein n=1 Tax=Clostridium sp. VAP52 TaxID=2949977 RepID=UPI00207A302E|nr:hypothetical protein [Clostridium sp. VAP52]
MDNRDYGYIKEEFKRQKIHNMNPIKMTNKLINKLLNKYNAYVFSELYYDDEKSNDSRAFNNWIDEYSEGNYGITNYGVKKMTINNLKYLKKYQYINTNDIRFYISETDELTQIYFYGRDLDIQCDNWFIFYDKETNKCLKCKKTYCWRHDTCGDKIEIK